MSDAGRSLLDGGGMAIAAELYGREAVQVSLDGGGGGHGRRPGMLRPAWKARSAAWRGAVRSCRAAGRAPRPAGCCTRASQPPRPAQVGGVRERNTAFPRASAVIL